MFNLNEKYFSISERCGRNHQNKFCLRPPKRRLCTWELSLSCYIINVIIKFYLCYFFSFPKIFLRIVLPERNSLNMELQEIKPRDLTDKIVEYVHMAEAEAEPLNRPEAELLVRPEPINRTISADDSESIYENPYSTFIYHDYGGSIIPPRNFIDDQSNDETIFQKIEKKKWYLLCLVLGLLIGVIVPGLRTTISGESKLYPFLLNINVL